jgi:hypothetical protein
VCPDRKTVGHGEELFWASLVIPNRTLPQMFVPPKWRLLTVTEFSHGVVLPIDGMNPVFSVVEGKILDR